MKTLFGSRYGIEDGIKKKDSPEILFLQTLACSDTETAAALFDENKQFGGLSAIDCPHGRYEGLSKIKEFVETWYSWFHAESGEVEVVNQIQSGCRSALEFVFIFHKADGSVQEIPMACAADLRDGGSRIDELRTYMNPALVEGYPIYRPPIFKEGKTYELRHEMLSGVMPYYFKTVHELGLAHIPETLTHTEPIKMGASYGNDPYYEGMYDEMTSQSSLPEDVEAPKYNLQDFVRLRMETIIDDGRICCVEWEQLITKRGREERYRLSEPGISFYERAADGWLKSIRIIDYANTERKIDWDNCPYDRETAEKINYLG